MAQVIWTEPALEDLRDIISFVAKDSPSYAAKLGARLVEAPRRLTKMPKSGGTVREFNLDHIREISVRPYRLIYVIRADVCYVVAVVHGARDLSRFLSADDLEGPA